MRTFLLDVNVLIALIDPMHVHHDTANDWFTAEGSQSWATCPMTQNGALRVVGHRSYGNSPGSPAAVVPVLARLTALGGHTFWPDDLSLLTSGLIDIERLTTSDRLTDTYLLALAVARSAEFATFDRRLSSVAVQGGAAALRVVS